MGASKRYGSTVLCTEIRKKETGLVMALGEAGRVIGGGIPPDLLPFIAAAPAADRKSSAEGYCSRGKELEFVY
jgi:hypothetical protein